MKKIRIPDEVFRQCVARAELRGETLEAFVTAALRIQLERGDSLSAEGGWQTVSGRLAQRKWKRLTQ